MSEKLSKTFNICICRRDTEYQQIQIYMGQQKASNPQTKLKRANADQM
jgi:hypothetical protein